MAYDDTYRYEPGRTDGAPDIEPTTLSLQPDTPVDAPANDRMGVHVCVEIALLLLFATALFMLYRDETSPLATSQIRNSIVVFIVPLLLCTIAVTTSMRVHAANLAVGATALASAVVFSELADYGLLVAASGAIGTGIGLGVAMAVVVLLFRVPPWLVSLGVAVGLPLWLQARVDLRAVYSQDMPELAPSNAWMWLAGVAVASVVLGIVGATGTVRERFGACAEATSSPGVRSSGATKLLTAVMLVASSTLAAAAGMWLVWSQIPAGPVRSVGLDPTMLTLFGFAAALVGGTSVYGRRGGVLGTLLACLVLSAVLTLQMLHGWRVNEAWILMVAAGVGLVVMRIVDAAGSPKRDAVGVAAATEDQDTATQPSAFDMGDIDPYRGPGR